MTFLVLRFFWVCVNNKRLNTILKKESKKNFDNIKIDYNLSNNLKDEVILKNIKYDYSKKLVLEDLLGSYREYILANPMILILFIIIKLNILHFQLIIYLKKILIK